MEIVNFSHQDMFCWICLWGYLKNNRH